MLRFGVCGRMTESGIQPAELATWLEQAGFESLWFGEHTHAPDADRTGRRDPEVMDQLYDPLLALATAAAVTRSITLGVSVSLLPLHHPISYAKSLATLDRLAAGRFVLGIGAGVIVREVEDFGVAFAERWKVTREHLAAIRTIWAHDVAEYDGRYVKFGPLRSWPKPLRPQGPPVLEGAFSKFTARRIAEYADGWLAWDGVALETTQEILDEIRREVSKAGRDPASLDLTMIMRVAADAPDAHERIGSVQRMGFGRVVLLMSPGDPATQWRELDGFKQLMTDSRRSSVP